MKKHRIALVLGLLAVPLAASALDFSDNTERYSDAPFSKAETAGISILTNLAAVSGNPDGTFAPTRPVNRAEFLKILFKSHPDILVTNDDAANCFPDVHSGDWFSQYVCLAKTRNVVGGYPDGKFRPGNTVNYAEALKMLSELYSTYPVVCLDDNPHGGCTQYKTYEVGAPWYAQYTDWAANEGLLLPGRSALDMPLTRGQVARLAASYRAWHDGELPQYRAFERGEEISSSSESSVASSSSSSSSVSSSQSSSSSSSVSSSASSSSSRVSLFPSTNHFLLTGRRSLPIVDGTFTSPDQDGAIRFVDITLRQEVKSISSMTLVNESGNELATLTLGTDNNTERRKWRADLGSNLSNVLPRGVPVKLGIELNLFPRLGGGVPNELVDGVESFSIIVNELTSNTSKNLVPTNFHNVAHQVTDARVTGVRNAGGASSTSSAGLNRVLGAFAVSGETATGGTLNLESLDFYLQKTDLAVTNIRIGGPAPVQQTTCGMDTVQMSKVTCPSLPDGFRAVGSSPLILTVYGDVTVRTGFPSGTAQITFAGPGTVGQSGALHWKDSSGHYNWIEASSPLESGTVWTFTQ